LNLGALAYSSYTTNKVCIFSYDKVGFDREILRLKGSVELFTEN